MFVAHNTAEYMRKYMRGYRKRKKRENLQMKKELEELRKKVKNNSSTQSVD